MEEQKRIEEIVSMLDEFVSSGGGHMNIQVKDQNAGEVTIDTFRSSDCSSENQPCQIPTLHQGVEKE